MPAKNNQVANEVDDDRDGKERSHENEVAAFPLDSSEEEHGDDGNGGDD